LRGAVEGNTTAYMPTKSHHAPFEIYQVKITLLYTDPPVWRRVLVPADLTLARLHDVLQVAMGWQDCHMHEFRAGGQFYGVPNPEERFFDLRPTIDDRKVLLSQVIQRPRAKLTYTYDMGDSWEHNVVLEKKLARDPSLRYPVCLAGERSCPPEDCGGIPGYYDLLEAMRDPKNERHDELLDWLGGEYDPEAFSVEEVNRALQPARQRRK
jgi:hypothetical protein